MSSNVFRPMLPFIENSVEIDTNGEHEYEFLGAIDTIYEFGKYAIKNVVVNNTAQGSPYIWYAPDGYAHLRYIYYCDDIEIDFENYNIIPIGLHYFTAQYADEAKTLAQNTLTVGKYFILYSDNVQDFSNRRINAVYKVTTETSFSKNFWNVTLNKAQYIANPRIEYTLKDTCYVTNKNAYPNGDTKDGFHYKLLREFTPDTQVVMGSYVGNGAYGENNETLIPFKSPPRYFKIWQKYDVGRYTLEAISVPNTVVNNSNLNYFAEYWGRFENSSGTDSSPQIIYKDGYLSITSTSNESEQMNSAYTYYYLAIL